MNTPPIDNILAPLLQALSSGNQVILKAPPGAGKSTYLPLQLLKQPSFSQSKIIMLEPRRLAARNIAHFIAKQLGESVGQTVGYRVRGEHKVSNNTRLEIITEGILTRMLQQNPELEGVDLIIFDEYHERSIHADTALAFCMEIQETLRDDLTLLVMSATLDEQAMQTLMPNSCIIESKGRSFPVDISYHARNVKAPLPPQVVNLINQALGLYDGNILVFLPGASEIKKVASQLNNLPPFCHVYPLYGQLTQAAQDLAINPTPKQQRKIVLATNIAETSLTIEGISLVIDSGLVNKASFNRNNGVTKLSKEQIIHASSIQRAGRAGRLQAGHCWRMWPSEQQARLAKYDTAEILQSDLLSLALELAKWGVTDVSQLSWLDVPPSHNLGQAQGLLTELDAINKQRLLSEHGKAIYQFGSDPRLAHMMLWSKTKNDNRLANTATLLAAMLEQTQALNNELDIENQLTFLQYGKRLSQPQQQILQQAKKYSKQLKVPIGDIDSTLAGILLAQAYPDRIAKRRGNNSQKYQLANGYGANMDENSAMFDNFVVVADLMSFSGGQNEGRIFLAARLDIEQLAQYSPAHFKRNELLQWQDKSERVVALVQTKIGSLVIDEKPLSDIPQHKLEQALLVGLRSKGLAYLGFSQSDEQLLLRLRFAHAFHHQASADSSCTDKAWPDYSEQALLDELETWLLPFFNGAKKLSTLKQINLHDALLSRIEWPMQQQLQQQFPTHLKVASGSNIRLNYNDSQQVKLSVRIQEMFGTLVNPTIGGRGQQGSQVLIELLSPAQRPIQLTQDLVGFWHGSYNEVKKDMKGRYPRHYWPDDPSIAMPTTRTKNKMNKTTK